MLTTFYEKHKRVCLAAAGIFTVFLIGLYLSALYEPGFWYMDTFLAEQKDGSFSNSNAYGSYYLNVERDDDNATVTFSIDELTREYLITGTETGEDVHIYEGDTLVFHGYGVRVYNSEYTLIGHDGYQADDLRIFASGIKPSPEELLPSYSWLYNRAASSETETRGEPSMLLLIIFLSLILAVDITFPDLFFTWNHRIYVDGGEPSEWYRTAQKISRVIIVGAILLCMVRSLYPF